MLYVHLISILRNFTTSTRLFSPFNYRLAKRSTISHLPSSLCINHDHDPEMSTSDEPLIVEVPIASSSRLRKPSGTARSISRHTSTSSRRSGKVLVESDDEPEFVGETISTKLAEKFTFCGPSKRPPSKSRSRSTSTRTELKKEEYKSPLTIPTLLPPVSLPEAPVPPWLGKPAILLQTKTCPVCKRSWKKSESGLARWVSLDVLNNTHHSDTYLLVFHLHIDLQIQLQISSGSSVKAYSKLKVLASPHRCSIYMSMRKLMQWTIVSNL